MENLFLILIIIFIIFIIFNEKLNKKIDYFPGQEYIFQASKLIDAIPIFLNNFDSILIAKINFQNAIYDILLCLILYSKNQNKELKKNIYLIYDLFNEYNIKFKFNFDNQIKELNNYLNKNTTLQIVIDTIFKTNVDKVILNTEQKELNNTQTKFTNYLLLLIQKQMIELKLDQTSLTNVINQNKII